MTRLACRLLVLVALLSPAPVYAQSLRVVSWNTANDVGSAGTDTHAPTVGGPAGRVLTAIGALNGSGSTRPIDVLALQESVYHTGSGVNPTAQGFVNVLNSIYGTGAYAAATLNGTTTGPTAGNGPNTLVYRTATVQVLSQVALGTPSGSSVSRQVMEYHLQPVGYSSDASFYLFNDHFKAGTTVSDNNRRGIEAGIITAAVNALPANTPVIYAGDYNPTNNTADKGYSGVVTNAGTNRAIDPLNPTNAVQDWSVSASKGMSTASPATIASFTGQGTGGIHYRDDFLMNSPGMLSGHSIRYIDGSFVAFGNTNTHTYLGSVTSGSAAAFAAELSGYTPAQASGVLSDLALSCDHLPVVADYQLTPVPEPAGVGVVMMFVIGVVGWWRKYKGNDAKDSNNRFSAVGLSAEASETGIRNGAIIIHFTCGGRQSSRPEPRSFAGPRSGRYGTTHRPSRSRPAGSAGS